MAGAILQGTAQLTVHEALSGVFGSISLASWIFLLIPQLVENYRQGSAEGISLLFLCVWFVGDIANLIGAVWAGLVPTVIALAIYFCFADSILISQCVYYNVINSRRRRKASEQSTNSEDSAETPLLGRVNSRNDSIGLPGSHRRSTAESRRRTSERRRDSLADIVEEGQGGSKEWLKNTLSVIAVCAAGAVGWVVAWKAGAWQPAADNGIVDDQGTAVGAQILGYASAVAYLGARIPQIIKNQRERSCEGLSLLFFLLSLLGNLTYGAGILFHSLEKDYIMTNLPWLIGSLGTMFEDVTIFIQFRVFGEESSAVI